MKLPLYNLMFVLVIIACFQSVCCTEHSTGLVTTVDNAVNFRCSTSHYCHKAFREQQWVAARQELGLDTPSTTNWKELTVVLSPKQKQFIGFMNGYHANAHSYITAENTTMFYARILKAGSESIVSNLRLLPNYEYAVFYSEAGLAEYRHKHLNNMYKDPTKAYLETFTFIRDPLAHFYSALAEVMDRTKHYGPKRNYTIEMIEAWTIESYIRALIAAELPTSADYSKADGQHPILAEIEHISPMSNAFFVYNITIVKHLENFTKDWEFIRSRYKLKDAFRYDIGHHRNTEVNFPGSTKTDDASHTRSRLKALFTEQPKYLRAVCHFIMIDYVCFEEYELPPACADMTAIRQQGRHLLESEDCKKSGRPNGDTAASKKTWSLSPRPKQHHQ